jgi:hypothetical protein
MKIDELVGSAADHVSDYIALLIGIFRAPTHYIPPESIERVTTSSKAGIILPSSVQVEQRLSPRLIGFVLVSLFIGVTIWNVILPEDKLLDTETSLVVVTVFWLSIGTVGHVYCWLLRGRGTYVQTLSASLHISAAVYVVSTFLAVLLGGPLHINAVFARFGFYLSRLGDAQGLYFALQLLLLSYYVPRTFAIVHGFGFTRRWLLLFLPLFMSSAAILLFFEMACVGC